MSHVISYFLSVRSPANESHVPLQLDLEDRMYSIRLDGLPVSSSRMPRERQSRPLSSRRRRQRGVRYASRGWQTQLARPSRPCSRTATAGALRARGAAAAGPPWPVHESGRPHERGRRSAWPWRPPAAAAGSRCPAHVAAVIRLTRAAVRSRCLRGPSARHACLPAHLTRAAATSRRSALRATPPLRPARAAAAATPPWSALLATPRRAPSLASSSSGQNNQNRAEPARRPNSPATQHLRPIPLTHGTPTSPSTSMTKPLSQPSLPAVGKADLAATIATIRSSPASMLPAHLDLPPLELGTKTEALWLSDAHARFTSARSPVYSPERRSRSSLHPPWLGACCKSG